MMPPKVAVSVPSTTAVNGCAPTESALAVPVTAKMARPSASAQNSSMLRGARPASVGRRGPNAKVRTETPTQMTTTVGSCTHATGCASSMSRTLPPPIPVTVPSRAKPNGSMPFRAATSAPVRANTPTPIHPAASARNSPIPSPPSRHTSAHGRDRAGKQHSAGAQISLSTPEPLDRDGASPGFAPPLATPTNAGRSTRSPMT